MHARDESASGAFLATLLVIIPGDGRCESVRVTRFETREECHLPHDLRLFIARRNVHTGRTDYYMTSVAEYIRPEVAAALGEALVSMRQAVKRAKDSLPPSSDSLPASSDSLPSSDESNSAHGVSSPSESNPATPAWSSSVVPAAIDDDRVGYMPRLAIYKREHSQAMFTGKDFVAGLFLVLADSTRDKITGTPAGFLDYSGARMDQLRPKIIALAQQPLIVTGNNLMAEFGKEELFPSHPTPVELATIPVASMSGVVAHVTHADEQTLVDWVTQLSHSVTVDENLVAVSGDSFRIFNSKASTIRIDVRIPDPSMSSAPMPHRAAEENYPATSHQESSRHVATSSGFAVTVLVFVPMGRLKCELVRVSRFDTREVCHLPRMISWIIARRSLQDSTVSYYATPQFLTPVSDEVRRCLASVLVDVKHVVKEASDSMADDSEACAGSEVAPFTTMISQGDIPDSTVLAAHRAGTTSDLAMSLSESSVPSEPIPIQSRTTRAKSNARLHSAHSRIPASESNPVSESNSVPAVDSSGLSRRTAGKSMRHYQSATDLLTPAGRRIRRMSKSSSDSHIGSSHSARRGARPYQRQVAVEDQDEESIL